MTGRCVCKPGVLGIKCDECPSGRILTVYGCTDESIFRPVPKSCSQMVCLFGAKCREMKDRVAATATASAMMTSKETTNSFTTSASFTVFNRSNNNNNNNNNNVSPTSQGNSLQVTSNTSHFTTRAQCVCDGLCDPSSPSSSSTSFSNSLHSTLPSASVAIASSSSSVAGVHSSFSIDDQSVSQAMLQDERLQQQLPKPLVLSTSLSNVNNGNKNLLYSETPDPPSVIKSLPLSLYTWWLKHLTFEERQKLLSSSSSSSSHKESRLKRDSSAVSTSEVCGSNGITYPSECELRLHSCRIQESIIVISKGPCKSKFVDINVLLFSTM